MKKKKVNQMFKTFPFNEVFSNRVSVDLNNAVLYDEVMGIAIAYIQTTNTHMVITFVLPEIADDNFEDVNISLSAYFSEDNVVTKDFTKFYFRIANGYYYLGHICSETNYQIRLPRLFDPDSVANETGTGNAGVEDFDEEGLDGLDLDDFDSDEQTTVD